MDASGEIDIEFEDEVRMYRSRVVTSVQNEHGASQLPATTSTVDRSSLSVLSFLQYCKMNQIDDAMRGG